MSWAPSQQMVPNETRQDLVERMNDAGKSQEIGNLELAGFCGRQGRFPILIDDEVRVF